MSKIYEALLQAELERLKDPNAVVADEVPIPTEEPRAVQPATPLRAPSPVQVQTSVRPVNNHGVNLERAGLHAWKPALDKLPSLKHRDAAAEQFRSLRARMYEYRGFNKLKSLMVSSGQAQEGKSFVAANLALILAHQKDNRVLLVDGDLRRASLHTLIGADTSPGLAEYLSGSASVMDVLQRPDISAMRNTPDLAALQNLTFIPAGSGGDQVADLTTNDRFRQLIELVSPHFDWIVVDSSPVNLVSDAVHLAREVDGVLLVVRAAVTPYEMAQRAQNEFKSANLLGVVLNGSTEAPPEGYYGYGSGE